MINRLKKTVKGFFSKPDFIRYLCRTRKKPMVFTLGYHNVCNENMSFSWLQMPKKRFEEQMQRLGKFCNFLEPNSLFQPAAFSSERPNLMVTFDDGYAGNYKVASPILKKYDIPAQFFVSTANVQTGDLFWFDKIIIPIGMRSIKHLNLKHLGLKAYNFPKNRNPEQLWPSIQKLLEDVKRLNKKGRERVIETFEETYKKDIMKSIDEFRPLRSKELQGLANTSLFSVGSHSHYHSILTTLKPEKLNEDLRRSKCILEEITGYSITDIAYPNGDSNPLVRNGVKNSGYRQAFGVSPGLVHDRVDRFNIPRILIGAFDDYQSVQFKIAKQLINKPFS